MFEYSTSGIGWYSYLSFIMFQGRVVQNIAILLSLRESFRDVKVYKVITITEKFGFKNDRVWPLVARDVIWLLTSRLQAWLSCRWSLVCHLLFFLVDHQTASVKEFDLVILQGRILVHIRHPGLVTVGSLLRKFLLHWWNDLACVTYFDWLCVST